MTVIVNPFDGGGYTLAEMTAAIQLLPNRYGRLGGLGLFTPEPISQRQVMPAVARLADLCTGHGCWPPRPNATGSPDVFVNRRPAHRQHDAWLPHTCPDIPETHASVQATGSRTVYVNGRQLARIGDPVACGSLVASGSPDVFAGD